MIGKFLIPIANRCVYRKWSSSRPTYVQARRARQFVAFFSSWVLFFIGWYFYFLEMSFRKKCIGSTIFCIVLAAFCCIWPSWRSTRTVMWTGRWKRRLFLKENHMCVSPHTFFLQVLPIKSSAALWPVVILKYFVLVERPLSTKNPLELNNMKSWLVWKYYRSQQLLMLVPLAK